ncbi:MAG: efflux RND transporter periplasmic adaptor subunit [Bacteroidales bacterium]|nr:efflux RND transporter periplasmic adaptor subunit [Bacteroidales bacterium]
MKTKFTLRAMSFLAVSALLFSCQEKTVQQSIPEYAVMVIEEEPVIVKNSFPAIISGYQDAEVRSNVSGTIIKKHIDKGDMVKKGDLLFEIDHAPYQADYNMALANVNSAKINVETAKLTAVNKTNLYEKGIISEYEKKLADNQLESAEAQLQQAEAKLEQARINLDYSYVKSPNDGVIGDIPFSVGSLVGSTTSEALTTVSQIDRVDADFSINEKLMLYYTSKGGVKDILKYMPEVELKLADGTTYEHKGTITSVSGSLDTKTGSASMTATFPNPAKILRSGATGVIFIPREIYNARLVPQNATFEMQDKKFVYIFNDSITEMREIKVDNLTYEQNYIVTEGLETGDVIVIEGVGSSVKNGMKMKPITKEEADAKFQKATTK